LYNDDGGEKVEYSLESAKYYLDSGNRQQAFEIYKELLVRNPNIPEAWYGMALCIEDIKSKLYCLNKALELKENYPEVKNLLWLISLQRNDTKEKDNLSGISRNQVLSYSNQFSEPKPKDIETLPGGKESSNYKEPLKEENRIKENEFLPYKKPLKEENRINKNEFLPYKKEISSNSVPKVKTKLNWVTKGILATFIIFGSLFPFYLSALLYSR